jgi:hypothetical protein
MNKSTPYIVQFRDATRGWTDQATCATLSEAKQGAVRLIQSGTEFKNVRIIRRVDEVVCVPLY